MSDVAGTTRDAIDTPVVHDGTRYTIVDTAGLRRKSQIDEDVEYYGFVRAMRAIDRADVALLVVDSTLGLTDQDQRVAGYAAERGCAMVIVLNKWDLVEGPEAKADIRERIADRMTFVGYAPVVAISALTGKKVDRIWEAIDQAYANYCQTIPTNRLNTWLADIRETGHTVSNGKAVLRMKYVTQTGTLPTALHVLREPSGPGERQLRAVPGKPPARELRPRGHADHAEIQEEGLGHAGSSGGRRTVRRGVPVGLHPLGARHFDGVLPYRHTAARQRQHRHHQRHAHDREGGRRGRVRARLREGPAFGRARVGVQPVSAAGGRAGARSARFSYDTMLAVAFLGCTWGHIFSPWLKFKGGKGIAVAVGCLFVTFGWVGACLELLIFAVLVVATKHVSVGSIAAAAACPFFALYFFWGDWLAWACCTIAALTVVWAHRGNIARLRAGTESRIGQKKEA